ncbi:hypothetical protein EB118_13545 [bacterium]|nr:hypothetical protein [bacterium]
MKSEQEIQLQVKRIMGKWYSESVFSKNKYIEASYFFFWKWYYKCTSGLYYKCKYALQRLFRGYDDLDKWNAAWYIARKSIPVLKAMRDKFHGTSLKWHREDRFGNLIELAQDEVFVEGEEPASFTEDEWRAILDDIIFAFQWQIDFDSIDGTVGEREYRLGMKRQKRGLKLFAIYFNCLWD